jgi:hypothetical protein
MVDSQRSMDVGLSAFEEIEKQGWEEEEFRDS